MEKRLDVQKRRDGKGLDRKRRTEGEKRRKKQKERGATTELTHLLTSAGSVSTRRTSCRRRIGRNQAMTSPSLEILKLVVVHTLCLGLATTCKHLREIRPLQEYVVAQAVRELGTLGHTAAYPGGSRIFAYLWDGLTDILPVPRGGRVLPTRQEVEVQPWLNPLHVAIMFWWATHTRWYTMAVSYTTPRGNIDLRTVEVEVRIGLREFFVQILDLQTTEEAEDSEDEDSQGGDGWPSNHSVFGTTPSDTSWEEEVEVEVAESEHQEGEECD